MGIAGCKSVEELECFLLVACLIRRCVDCNRGTLTLGTACPRLEAIADSCDCSSGSRWPLWYSDKAWNSSNKSSLAAKRSETRSTALGASILDWVVKVFRWINQSFRWVYLLLAFESIKDVEEPVVNVGRLREMYLDLVKEFGYFLVQGIEFGFRRISEG